MVDLNRVATFVVIAEAGGVTAAASRLRLPKSSVSRSLSQLEHELGAQLVVRGSRQFRLSDEGRAFVEAASRGIAAVEEAEDVLREGASQPHGLIRVAAPPDHGALMLAPTIASFVKKYPKVEVELSLGTRQADPIRDGFDVVVCVGELEDSALIARSLGTVDEAVFASPKYLKEHGAPKRPGDLVKHACIVRRSARWVLTGPNSVETVIVKGPVRIDDFQTSITLANADVGLVCLPIHSPGATGLQRVLPNHIVRGEKAQLVYPASRHTPRRVTLFVEQVMTELPRRCTAHAAPRVS